MRAWTVPLRGSCAGCGRHCPDRGPQPGTWTRPTSIRFLLPRSSRAFCTISNAGSRTTLSGEVIEAEKILKTLSVDERSRSYISYAIRNHEAFKAVCDLDDAAGCMVSDALYDADKFRWGPENFTGTLWIMVEDHQTPPETLHKTFHGKNEGDREDQGNLPDRYRQSNMARNSLIRALRSAMIIYDEMSELLTNRE